MQLVKTRSVGPLGPFGPQFLALCLPPWMSQQVTFPSLIILTTTITITIVVGVIILFIEFNGDISEILERGFISHATYKSLGSQQKNCFLHIFSDDLFQTDMTLDTDRAFILHLHCIHCTGTYYRLGGILAIIH